MTWSRWLPWFAVGLTIVVWAIPLQLGAYADSVITDIPTYQRAYLHIADGQVPYADFNLEYPPLAAALFWLAGALPGPYGVTFSILMLACLCAIVLGVIALARAIGLDVRRQTAAAVLVAVSPLMIGNLVETRFDLALSALVVWTLWAAATNSRPSPGARARCSPTHSVHEIAISSPIRTAVETPAITAGPSPARPWLPNELSTVTGTPARACSPSR